MNENSALSAIAAGNLLKEGKVAHGVEHVVAAVEELGAVEFHRPEDLHALALPCDRDLGLVAETAPGGMQSRVLPETGFVGEDQLPVVGFRFFFRFGKVLRCQRSFAAASARASTRRGRCTEKPIRWSSFRTWPG